MLLQNTLVHLLSVPRKLYFFFFLHQSDLAWPAEALIVFAGKSLFLSLRDFADTVSFHSVDSSNVCLFCQQTLGENLNGNHCATFNPVAVVP